MIKYEYKMVEFRTDVDPASAISGLNELGAEGWLVIHLTTGSYSDDVAHGRIWMAREVQDEKKEPIEPTA